MAVNLLGTLMAFLIVLMLARYGGLEEVQKLSVSSPVFADGGRIEPKYTCNGADVSPPVKWSKGPAGTASYALIVDDPDAPRGTFTHWVIFNIPAGTTELFEYVTAVGRMDDGTTQGKNHFDRIGYGGPCPPPGKPHHYRFNVYALDTKLGPGPGASKEDVLKSMDGHILARGTLTGIYGG